MRPYLFLTLCLILTNIVMVYSVDAQEVKITIPHNGDTVPGYFEVAGTAKGITSGQAIWIFVNSPGTDRYYPQHSVEITPNGFWYTNATIGENAYSGSEYKILAVIADDKANKILMSYLDESKRNDSWNGLASLPDGSMPRDMITVKKG